MAFVQHMHNASRRLGTILRTEAAEALVHYDGGGIYGHPDHVAVNTTGVRAARREGVTAYEATVDRDHLAAVPGHLLELAAAGTHMELGRPSRSVTTRVNASADELERKHR